MAYAHLQQIGLRQEQIPFIVQLIENPRFELPGIEIFPGATDLPTHDCIHILLGRGLASIDEAFVLGYTMGSTNRLNATEEALYTFFARNFYPEGYKFGDDEGESFVMRCGWPISPGALLWPKSTIGSTTIKH